MVHGFEPLPAAPRIPIEVGETPPFCRQRAHLVRIADFFGVAQAAPGQAESGSIPFDACKKVLSLDLG